MYVSLRDRPGAAPGGTSGTASGDAGSGTDTPAKRRKVAPVVITLGLVSLLTDISSESVSAILPLYLTLVVGLSPVAYGFIDGLYQGVSSLVRIGGGWAADRGGHPKWVAFLGYGVSVGARIGLLFAAGLGTVSAVVTADRVGKGLRTAPRDAMISAATDPAHLGHAFGVHRTLDTIGAALGPLIAFVILWMIPDGYLTVMVVSLGFAVLGLTLLGLFVQDRPEPARQEAADRRFRWADVANPQMTRLLVAAGVLGLLTVGDGFIYLTLLDRGQFAATWFPLLYVGTNVAYLALAIPVGRLADRVGRARVLVLGHVALVAAYVGTTAPVSLAWTTLGVLGLLGAFYAATDGVAAALAGSLVPAEVRASGIASVQTVVALSRLGASFGFGVLWVTMGPQRAMVVVAGLLAIAIPFALVALTRLDAAREVTA